MIKLIGIDMDGTLLDKDKLVSRENIEAINQIGRASCRERV